MFGARQFRIHPARRGFDKARPMTSRPNFLFLLPDQLRHDYLGCSGADFLSTPAIDALAAYGTWKRRSLIISALGIGLIRVGFDQSCW